MRYAWVEDGKIRDICAGDPSEYYHHDVAMYYDQQVPDDAANGDGWDGVTLTKPLPPDPDPPPMDPIPSPTQWLIDIGPFYDRFGAKQFSILASSDAQTRAIVSSVSVRKWIDLKRDDVQAAVSYLSVTFGLTEEEQYAILNTPVTDAENLALRRLYFS